MKAQVETSEMKKKRGATSPLRQARSVEDSDSEIKGEHPRHMNLMKLEKNALSVYSTANFSDEDHNESNETNETILKCLKNLQNDSNNQIHQVHQFHRYSSSRKTVVEGLYLQNSKTLISFIADEKLSEVEDNE